ncbi:MAG TPA: helix-turn-helix domain-containing GNAT family N-acetyltransferase [Syntrophomonadaceae bacterium]|nr:helix-turn-helix domain-containing GNAT family N-acetyltransferase [Syntrophomonadaceae bacterium]
MGEILREVGMIARCFESMANIEFKEYALSKNQYIYLVRICENPGIIQERVAELLKVDRSTASRAIEKLKNARFIKKKSHPDNKKNIMLYPTPLGNEVYIMLKNDEDYSTKVALNGFTNDEKENLLLLLRRIRQNIEPDWEMVKRGGRRLYTRANLKITRKGSPYGPRPDSKDDYEIVQYHDDYIKDLKRLSYEWLEKYVSVEPEDERLLNNPRETILDKGGCILFARLGNEIVGTISMIKMNTRTYELAKLAVTETHQGHNIGRDLIASSIQFAIDRQADKIILYTNHVLKPAIHLYEHFGFKEITLENNKYLEADIKMELNLIAGQEGAAYGY